MGIFVVPDSGSGGRVDIFFPGDMVSGPLDTGCFDFARRHVSLCSTDPVGSALISSCLVVGGTAGDLIAAVCSGLWKFGVFTMGIPHSYFV